MARVNVIPEYTVFYINTQPRSAVGKWVSNSPRTWHNNIHIFVQNMWWEGLVGGIGVGLSSAGLLLVTGRLTGISGEEQLTSAADESFTTGKLISASSPSDLQIACAYTVTMVIAGMLPPVLRFGTVHRSCMPSMSPMVH